VKISRRQSNFAQFSDDLWLEAEHDGTTIQFDVCEDELADFAIGLLDIADDCLRKIKQDTGYEEGLLADLMNAIDATKQEGGEA